MSFKLNISPIDTWLPDTPRPLVIAGPCGAETEDQVLSTAREIAKFNKVSIFRAGVWKPRTRPDSFEGAGTIALQWLKRVKQETGILTTVEVANAKHVEEALKNGIDILWIGARTTVNPFYVQEIADVLKGVNIPVMIKNPVSPDINLWIGAIERFNKAGITKLVAIHRGFYSFKKTKYRNDPGWEIPIELKSIFPELPVICDPSHISGNKELITEVAQKALDLDMAGLMIETHVNPENALSDSEQQLTPFQLNELISGLTVRKTDSNNKEFVNQLSKLRNIIDDIDDEIIQMLAKRMQVVEKIGEYKRDNNVTILQVERWLEILRTRTQTGILKEMRPEFIEKLCQLLHQESIRKQTEIMNNSSVEK